MITFIRQNLLLVLLLAAARSGACQRDPKDPGPVDPPPVAGTEIPPGKRMEVIKSTEGKFASLNWNDAAAAQNEPVDFLKTPAADRSSLHCTRQRQRMDPVYRRRTAPAGQQPDRLPGNQSGGWPPGCRYQKRGQCNGDRKCDHDRQYPSGDFPGWYRHLTGTLRTRLYRQLPLAFCVHYLISPPLLFLPEKHASAAISRGKRSV